MILERLLSKNLAISGPLTACLATAPATLNEIECSIAIQNGSFQNLANGLKVPLEEVIRWAAQLAADDAAKSTCYLRIPAKAGFKHTGTCRVQEGYRMAYSIVAERDNETVRMRRGSSIIAIAKARVWASEGWAGRLIDAHENPLAPGGNQRLLPAGKGAM